MSEDRKPAANRDPVTQRTSFYASFLQSGEGDFSQSAAIASATIKAKGFEKTLQGGGLPAQGHVNKNQEISGIIGDDQLSENVAIPTSPTTQMRDKDPSTGLSVDDSAGTGVDSDAQSSFRLPTSPLRRSTASSNGSLARRKSSLQQRPSWYHDAINSGFSAEQLEDALGSPLAAAAAAANEDSGDGFADEEVLEQYRIMALHEAHQRVLQNLGFDPLKRPSEPKVAPRADLKPIVSFPKLKKPNLDLTVNHHIFQPSLPTKPFPENFERFILQSCHREPELQVGTATSAQPTAGQMGVRCLGCGKNLVVSQLATLVSCPECSTVSSATSTRR
jgi:ribosomal protein S27E